MAEKETKVGSDRDRNIAYAVEALLKYKQSPTEEQMREFESHHKAKSGSLEERVSNGIELLITMALNDIANKDLLESVMNKEVDARLSFEADIELARSAVRKAGKLDLTDEDIHEFEKWLYQGTLSQGFILPYVRNGLEGIRALAATDQRLITYLQKQQGIKPE